MKLLSSACAVFSFLLYLLLLPYVAALKLLGARLPALTFSNAYELAESLEFALWHAVCALSSFLGFPISSSPPLQDGDAVWVAPHLEDLILALAEKHRVLVTPTNDALAKRLVALAGPKRDNIVLLPPDGVAGWLNASPKRRLKALVFGTPMERMSSKQLEMIPPEELHSALEASVISAHKLLSSSLPFLRTSGGRVLAILPSSLSSDQPTSTQNTINSGIRGMLDTFRVQESPHAIGVSILEYGRLRTTRRGSIRRQSISVPYALPDRAGAEGGKAQAPMGRFWEIPQLSPLVVTDTALHALTARYPMMFYAVGVDVKVERVRRMLRGVW